MVIVPHPYFTGRLPSPPTEMKRQSPMEILKSQVYLTEYYNENYFHLILEVNTNKDIGLPGQFYQIQYAKKTPKLRIPISIYETDYFDTDKVAINFMIKIVGEKTQALADVREGTWLSIIGPLGNHFEYDEHKSYLLVSGGCGYAPLHYFYNYYHHKNMTWFHGCANADDAYIAEKSYIHTLTTDDGSAGIKGFVTDAVEVHLRETSNKYDQVYACGPKPMLKALHHICQSYGLPLSVSLEEYMACGVGVCYGCAVKTTGDDGNRPVSVYSRVCKDGPIFKAENIIWE